MVHSELQDWIGTTESVDDRTTAAAAEAHDMRAEDDPAISEEQDLVYRGPPRPGEAPAGRPAEEIPAAEWSRTHTTDPVLLFRDSALTFNSHRSHYDHPFATEVEGYPGLVVQGSLILALLVEALTVEPPGRSVAALIMRALQPVFHGEPFRVEGRLAGEGDRAELWCVNAGGGLAMQASAELGGGPPSGF